MSIILKNYFVFWSINEVSENKPRFIIEPKKFTVKFLFHRTVSNDSRWLLTIQRFFFGKICVLINTKTVTNRHFPFLLSNMSPNPKMNVPLRNLVSPDPSLRSIRYNLFITLEGLGVKGEDVLPILLLIFLRTVYYLQLILIGPETPSTIVKISN